MVIHVTVRAGRKDSSLFVDNHFLANVASHESSPPIFECEEVEHPDHNPIGGESLVMDLRWWQCRGGVGQDVVLEECRMMVVVARQIVAQRVVN